MNKASKKKRLSADEIAHMAERGEDISRYFTNTGKIKYPVKRVNVDFTVLMLKELDQIASELHISRQALQKFGRGYPPAYQPLYRHIYGHNPAN